MKKKEPSEVTDQELVAQEKKRKSSAMMNATFIGFIFGIVVWGVAKNNIGFFALIPLYFAYKLFTKNNERQEKI